MFFETRKPFSCSNFPYGVLSVDNRNSSWGMGRLNSSTELKQKDMSEMLVFYATLHFLSKQWYHIKTTWIYV